MPDKGMDWVQFFGARIVVLRSRIAVAESQIKQATLELRDAEQGFARASKFKSRGQSARLALERAIAAP